MKIATLLAATAGLLACGPVSGTVSTNGAAEGSSGSATSGASTGGVGTSSGEEGSSSGSGATAGATSGATAGATAGVTAGATAGKTSGGSSGATSGKSSAGSSGAGASGGSGGAGSSSGGTAPSGLQTMGGHLVDGSGKLVQLHGVDRSGTEFACTYQSGGSAAQGFPGFFDGPNDQAGVDAMLAWHVNAVRVPLNEDCWLGLNGYPMNDSAADYQTAILDWVELLNQNGMVVVLDLHWAAPGTDPTSTSVGQLPMADADHSPAFWSSVAGTFASHSSVIFDLFNEPYITDWSCWTSGAPASAACAKDENGTAYAVAGMANLLQAVRNAGADNVVILGGLSYSADFSSWVSSVNSIPGLPAPLDGISIANVAASWHAYDFNSVYSECPTQYNNYNSTCTTGAGTAANDDITGVIGAGFPVLIGESGISAFSAASAMPFTPAQITEIEQWYTGTDGLLPWMDSQGQSYLAWSWNTDTDPVLVTDYTGTATPYFGASYQAYLQQL